MASYPEPSSRLRVEWAHDGLSCELDGAGSVGPVLLLLGLPGLALATTVALPSELTVLLMLLSLPAAYFLSTRWAQATLDPIEITVRRDRLTWKSGWQPTVTLDLAAVHAVRARPWGLLVWREDHEPLRLFSPSRRRDLLWIADRIHEAAVTAREVVDDLERPEARARRAALDALRSPEGPNG